MNILSLGSISPIRLNATRQIPSCSKPNLCVLKRGSILELRSELLASAARAATRRELLDRLFSIAALQGVRVDSRRGSALLDFKPNQPTVAEALEALSVAMRLRQPERLPLPNEHFLFTVAFDGVFEVRRAERKLTLWQIDELGPERFVAVHPLLRCDAVREHILDILSCLAGVSDCFAHGVGGLEISCQPHRVNHAILLEVLEPAIGDAVSLAGRAESPLGLRSMAVTANSALAPSTVVSPDRAVLAGAKGSVFGSETDDRGSGVDLGVGFAFSGGEGRPSKCKWLLIIRSTFAPSVIVGYKLENSAHYGGICLDCQ
jgi:hypothetical protein